MRFQPRHLGYKKKVIEPHFAACAQFVLLAPAAGGADGTNGVACAAGADPAVGAIASSFAGGASVAGDPLGALDVGEGDGVAGTGAGSSAGAAVGGCTGTGGAGGVGTAGVVIFIGSPGCVGAGSCSGATWSLASDPSRFSHAPVRE